MPSKKKTKSRHLGRGLQSLIGPITFGSSEQSQPEAAGGLSRNFPIDKELRDSLGQLDIDLVDPNPYQPRTVWDDEQLGDLAESIRVNGVIQPVIVRQTEGRYEIIAGERRLRAAKLAGLSEIPALIRQANEEEMLELALAENIHRSDLNPMERAKAYRNYLNTFSVSQTEAAERLGENRSVVANYLRLLDLPGEVKQMLVDGSLSMGHARAILGVNDDDLRKKLANRAMAGRLSVREVENLVRKYTQPVGQTPEARRKPAHIIDLENKLRSELGTKVSVETRKSGQRGKIIIEFYSLDEFDRITERIGLTSLEEV